jgi:hypothetical protein
MPLNNAHNLTRLQRFFIGVGLALSCDLLCLRWLLLSSNEIRMRAEPLTKTRVRFRSGGKGKVVKLV